MTPTNFCVSTVKSARSVLGTRMRGGRYTFRDFAVFPRILTSIASRQGWVNVTEVWEANNGVRTSQYARAYIDWRGTDSRAECPRDTTSS